MKKTLTFFALIACVSTLSPVCAFGQELLETQTGNATVPYIKEIKEYKASWFDNIIISKEFKDLILQSSESIVMYSNGSNVNIRTEPNTNCEVIDQLLLNTQVEVIAEHDGWSCITGESGIGFVKSDYLQEQEVDIHSLGTFKITYYCCEKYKHICGDGKGITRSGTPVRPGVVSVDPSVIPLGSKVKINGHTYIAEDTGSMVKGNVVDIAVDTHEQALELGVDWAEVFLIIE